MKPSTTITAYHKTYRNELNDKIKNQPKNTHLNMVLNQIFNKPTDKDLIIKILKYTIANLTGKSDPVSDDNIMSSVKFLTGNDNNYWFTGHQAIPRGAIQIIFAACYELAASNHIPVIIPDNINIRAGKILLVNQVIDHLVQNRDEFPDLPREAAKNINSGARVIKFSKDSYFDISSISENGQFTVAGDGYNYVQANGIHKSPNSPNNSHHLNYKSEETTVASLVNSTLNNTQQIINKSEEVKRNSFDELSTRELLVIAQKPSGVIDNLEKFKEFIQAKNADDSVYHVLTQTFLGSSSSNKQFLQDARNFLQEQWLKSKCSGTIYSYQLASYFYQKCPIEDKIDLLSRIAAMHKTDGNVNFITAMKRISEQKKNSRLDLDLSSMGLTNDHILVLVPVIKFGVAAMKANLNLSNNLLTSIDADTFIKINASVDFSGNQLTNLVYDDLVKVYTHHLDLRLNGIDFHACEKFVPNDVIKTTLQQSSDYKNYDLSSNWNEIPSIMSFVEFLARLLAIKEEKSVVNDVMASLIVNMDKDQQICTQVIADVIAGLGDCHDAVHFTFLKLQMFLKQIAVPKAYTVKELIEYVKPAAIFKWVMEISTQKLTYLQSQLPNKEPDHIEIGLAYLQEFKEELGIEMKGFLFEAESGVTSDDLKKARIEYEYFINSKEVFGQLIQLPELEHYFSKEFEQIDENVSGEFENDLEQRESETEPDYRKRMERLQARVESERNTRKVNLCHDAYTTSDRIENNKSIINSNDSAIIEQIKNGSIQTMAQLNEQTKGNPNEELITAFNNQCQQNYNKLHQNIVNGLFEELSGLHSAIGAQALTDKQIDSLIAQFKQKNENIIPVISESKKIVNNVDQEIITSFKSAKEFELFISTQIENKGDYDIINRKDDFLNELEKLGYSTAEIEKNQYTDICYNHNTKQFELSKNSTLMQVDVGGNNAAKYELNDFENKENKLGASSVYAAPKEQVIKLRQELVEFVIADTDNYDIYVNAFAGEVGVQFLEADDLNDLIWSDDANMRKFSNSVGDLAKTLRTLVFPECNSKDMLIKLLKDTEQMKAKLELLAQTLLALPNVLVNENIARNFCKHKAINFEKIALVDNHFYPADGKPEDIKADGDCFFHTIKKIMG